MKLYLITLLISTLTLFIYVKCSYKYASVNDTVEPPIDYEDTQAYKDNEVWFSGMGRCWMKTYTQEQVDKILEDMHKGYKKIMKKHDDEMQEFTIKYMKGLIIKSVLLGLVNGAIIGLMIGSLLWCIDRQWSRLKQL